jgi:hypothetical protein
MKLRLAVTALAMAAVSALCLGQADEKPTTTSAPTTQPGAGKPPKPTVVPLQWEFNLDLDDMRSIPVRPAGEKSERLFWYLRYTVTNPSDSDHVFVPEFVMYTDTGQVIRSGRKAPTDVFYAIKKLHDDTLMKTQTSMTRKLLMGQDNAKAGVAIWPDFDPNAGQVDVFIGGLSGETVAIDLPEPVTVTETDWKGETHQVTKNRLLLSKTLHLRYAIPGDKAHRRFAVPKLTLKEWVMR